MICTDNVRIVSMINGTCNLAMERKRLTLVHVAATFTFECWFNSALTLFTYRIAHVLRNSEHKRDYEDMSVITK